MSQESFLILVKKDEKDFPKDKRPFKLKFTPLSEVERHYTDTKDPNIYNIKRSFKSDIEKHPRVCIFRDFTENDLFSGQDNVDQDKKMDNNKIVTYEISEN